MRLNRYENFMLYVLGVIEFVERHFIKLFPSACFMFLFVYVYGLIGGLDNGNLTASDIPSILTVFCVIGVLTLLYKLQVYKSRIRNSKRRKRNVNRDY